MSKVSDSLYSLRLFDDLSRKKTFIHDIHPLSKLLTTVVYLIIVVSFGKYEISRLVPFIIYPILLFSLGDIPIRPVLNRVLFVFPFIFFIGIFSPILDKQMVVFYGISFSKGWFAFLSIMFKCLLTVTAALLLIATTGMDKLSMALRILKIPKILVLQLQLTYRYITVMMEEVASILRAYAMRAPRQKGVHHSVWGSLSGQLILRTYGRAERVYDAMCLRGFNGEYNTGSRMRLTMQDILYCLIWCSFFYAAWRFNLPMLLGSLFTGGF